MTDAHARWSKGDNMSQRGSYDYHPRGGRFPTSAEVDACASVGLRPVRTVIWRDEWPAQEDVPHVGETVWFEGYAKPYTVIHGLPIKLYRADEWSLHVVDDDGLVSVVHIDCLSRTPPTKRYRVKLHEQNPRYGKTRLIEATDEADAIAKAVTVEEVDDD